MNSALLKSQILFEAKRNGVVAQFFKKTYDERNEETGEFEQGEDVKGIFHQVKTRQERTVSDTIMYSTRPQPHFTCVDDEYKKNQISMNDLLKINDKQYRITAVNNVQDFGVVYTFSLEVINDGTVET